VGKLKKNGATHDFWGLKLRATHKKDDLGGVGGGEGKEIDFSRLGSSIKIWRSTEKKRDQPGGSRFIAPGGQ